MKSLMCFKICALGKGFVTNIALVGFFSSMNSMMNSEARGGTEAFPTFAALVWFLFNVDCLLHETVCRAEIVIIYFQPVLFLCSVESLILTNVRTQS